MLKPILDSCRDTGKNFVESAQPVNFYYPMQLVVFFNYRNGFGFVLLEALNDFRGAVIVWHAVSRFASFVEAADQFQGWNLDFNNFGNRGPVFFKHTIQDIGLHKRSRVSFKNKPFHALGAGQFFLDQLNHNFVGHQLAVFV